VLERPSLAIVPGRPDRITGYWDATVLRCQLVDSNAVVLEAKKGPGFGTISAPTSVQLASTLEPWDRQFGVLPMTLAGLVSSPEGIFNIRSSSCPLNLESIPDTAIKFDQSDREISVVPGLTCLNRVGSPDYLWGEETALLGACKLFPDLLRGSKMVCVPGEVTRWIVLRHGHILYFTSSIPCTIFRMMKSDPLFGGTRAELGIGYDAFLRGVEKAEETPSTDLIHLLLQVRNRRLKEQLSIPDMASFLLGMLIGRDISQANRLLQLDKLRSPMILLTDGVIGALYERAVAAQRLRATKLDLGRAINIGLSLIR